MNNIEVICEIGKNFVISEQEEPLNVLLARAKELISRAKECGCDTAKFQVHASDEIHPSSQLVSPHFNEERGVWIKRNSYPVEFYRQIQEHCRKIGIEFLATPMSIGAAILLNEDIGVERWKIGSADILDFVMLDYIRDSGRPVILSSGMSSIEELEMSYYYLIEKTINVSILHCVSIYPCPIDKVNLKTIPFLKKKFPNAQIGFSDHSLGINASLMAVSLGAEIIEKHFTLDTNAWGPDHKTSIMPDEMTVLVRRIRENNLREPEQNALGVETKYINPQEQEFRKVFRKGLYASRDIKKNDILESDMFLAMRPKLGGTEPSEKYAWLLEKRAKHDIPQYAPIK